jgi:hypothetical protein
MDSLKLKIGDDYPFNEDEGNKSQYIENYFSNLRNHTMIIPIHSVVEKINEPPSRPEGPPEKLQKIQIPGKSVEQWSPLKLPGIPDLRDQTMQFPVKSVKEKITKLFPGEPLTPSPEWYPEKLTGSPDLPNQTLQIPVESVEKVNKIFSVELSTSLPEKLAGISDSFTTLEKPVDNLDYDFLIMKKISKMKIHTLLLMMRNSLYLICQTNTDKFRINLRQMRSLKYSMLSFGVLELIRKKFRKCHVGM